MAKRIPITIGGRPYTLLSDEDPGYMRKLAELVNIKILDQRRGNLSEVESAVMAALIIADDFMKAEASAEHVKGQITGCLDDLAQVRAENAELKRELAKYKK